MPQGGSSVTAVMRFPSMTTLAPSSDLAEVDVEDALGAQDGDGLIGHVDSFLRERLELRWLTRL